MFFVLPLLSYDLFVLLFNLLSFYPPTNSFGYLSFYFLLTNHLFYVFPVQVVIVFDLVHIYLIDALI